MTAEYDEKRSPPVGSYDNHPEEIETPDISDKSEPRNSSDEALADGMQLRRTISSRNPPNPLCSKCKQGLTNEESQPCAVHDGYITDPNVVLWDSDDDPGRPQNWPLGKKIAMTVTASLFVAGVSFSSSIFGPATHVTAKQFGVGIEVMDLAISLHILGFACGPLLFGPMSEVFGRLIPFYTGLIGMAIFQIPEAVAGNVRTILVCRFFEGVFGSAIFAVVSGIFVDIWSPIARGNALALSATGINLGSTFAPIFSGFVVQQIGWRWTAWLTLIYCGTVGVLGILTMHETFEPVLLARKAKHLRFETKNFALHAKSEEQPVDIKTLAQKYLTKPIRIIINEPILIILTAYLTLVYGILYLSYQAIPFSFQNRGWSPAVSQLPFISVLLGILAAWGVFCFFNNTSYKKTWLKTRSAPPEARLPPMILGSVILPPALWWFGWSQHTHWASQVIALFFVGLGLLLIFDTGIVYLVDVYAANSNSAMSIHVVCRSIISCSFPLFSGPMYTNLGTDWASTVLAFACLAMVAAPLIFYFYGAKIRSWSRFSMS
ncbi:hypothetical protein AAFC00_001167 [Neodothiora populina]|uniref:Major facilitator superfamily (MFS) profile domain-containing protein n=1 Tax=Neodothiora populina TaxID=2781224 RepID=A0ABR3PP09_9PEZI